MFFTFCGDPPHLSLVIHRNMSCLDVYDVAGQFMAEECSTA